jgi:membrane protein required for colicin V production
MAWNILDIVFVIIIVFLAIRGLIRGFLGEIFSVGSVVAGLGAAVFFSSALAGPVERALGISGWGQIIAFLGIFVVAYLVMKLVEKALRNVVEGVNLQNLDKALGFFLGLVEGAVVAGLLVLVLRAQPLFDFSGPLSGSVIARILTPVVAYGAQTFNVKLK